MSVFGRRQENNHYDDLADPQSAIRNRRSCADPQIRKFGAMLSILRSTYSEIFPPGSSTIGSAAVCERTRSAQAAASCAIGGQVL